METLPEDVRQFLLHHIESVVQLETLLLLQSRPEKVWTRESLSREMRIDPAGASSQLDSLCAQGLLECTTGNDPEYRYTARGEIDAVIRSLAELYPERRVTIVTLIYTKPVDRLRSFADAFRIRRDKEKG